VAVIRQEMDTCMVRMDGVRRSRRYLADLQTILAQSARTNAEVSRAVPERARPNQKMLSDIEEQSEQLAQQNAVVRAFQFLTVRRLIHTYLLAAEADLRCQAELTVRTALDQYLYRPLLATIGQEVARVDGHVARLEALRDRAATGAKDMANLPSDYLVSVGIEFATAEFCVRKTRLLIADLGGTKEATRRVFQTFLEQVKSLDVLRDRDLDAVERTLVPICQKLFEDTIKAMDVLTIFAEEFAEPGRQREVVEQLVREASGRLVVTGEAGRQIPWIKIVGFGTAAGAEGFLRLLRDTDHEIGEWLPCDHGDRYSVTLVMYRSQVSLEGHLRHLRRRLLEGAPTMTVDSGADPIIWLLPSADPGPEEVAATIVRGLAAGGISQSGTLFSHIDPETGESSLGGNAAEVHRALAESYVARLHLTLDFVRALATRHDETLAHLKALRAVLGNSGSVLAELLGEEVIQAVEQNAQDL
jgi:hypothetical protein